MPSCRRYREVLRTIGWLVTENGDANVGSMPAATTSKQINIIMAKVLSYGKKHPEYLNGLGQMVNVEDYDF